MIKKEEIKTEEKTWGILLWFVNLEMSNKTELTEGKCIILPGQSNEKHFHPNCQEVLHLLSGRIIHAVGDEKEVMNPGDTVIIPKDITHYATNIGNEVAEMIISYNTPTRKTIVVAEEAK